MRQRHRAMPNNPIVRYVDDMYVVIECSICTVVAILRATPVVLK
jgi:hypothetical protein